MIIRYYPHFMTQKHSPKQSYLILRIILLLDFDSYFFFKHSLIPDVWNRSPKIRQNFSPFYKKRKKKLLRIAVAICGHVGFYVLIHYGTLPISF